MKKEEIFTTIASEINYCETTVLPSNPSITPTEMARLGLIDKYMLSQYRDSTTDMFGNQMVFYNISSFPVEVASKMVDHDTKDISLMAQDERYWETWLMEKELRFWMGDRKFGKFLNDVSFMLPRDGHIVAKKVDDTVELVPLKNLRFRPDALHLKSTPIIEKYEYFPDEFVAEAKMRGWENWQKVGIFPDKTAVGQFSKDGKVQVFGAWFPEGFLSTESNYFIVSYDGHILADWSQEIFYKDLAWEKVFGRLLGRGNVEKLFNEQIYLNRIANYKADGLNWSSKHWYQTRDNQFKTNLLGNSDNGDIFITNDPIEPVAVEERNLSFYAQEEARWEQQAYKRVFTTEPITGNRAPSGTPLGSTILQAQMTQGFYDPKKENISMFIKEILEDWIMPSFKKSTKGNHSLVMKNLLTSEKGAEKFFNLQLNYLTNKQKFAKFLPQEMWDVKKALLAEKLKNAKIELPRGFYDDLKYKMTVTIGSEAIDTAGKLTTLWQFINTIGTNPVILQNKMVKSALYKAMELAGFNMHDFEDEEVPTVQGVAQQAQAMHGGSIAAPALPSSPMQAPAMQKA